MKVIVATGEPGNHGEDFNWCEGEEMVLVNNRICENPGCGCDRDFSGFDSHKGTTTGKVVDRAVTEAEVVAAAIASEKAGGWDIFPGWMVEAARKANRMMDIAASLPVGTIVRQQNGEVTFSGVVS